MASVSLVHCSVPSAPLTLTHPCYFRNGVERETAVIRTQMADTYLVFARRSGPIHNDPMRDRPRCYPIVRGGTRGTEGSRSLVRIILTISDRQNWDLNSGCPALDSPACALPRDTRQRVGGHSRGVGSGGAPQSRAMEGSPQLLRGGPCSLTPVMGAPGHGNLGHPGWGDNQDIPHFRERVTEAREVPGQTDPHFFNTCCVPSPHLIDVLYSSGQPREVGSLTSSILQVRERGSW